MSLLPADVDVRLELIANEYRNNPSETLRKLFSHYSLSLAWLERNNLSEDYYEFCSEIMIEGLKPEN